MVKSVWSKKNVHMVFQVYIHIHRKSLVTFGLGMSRKKHETFIMKLSLWSWKTCQVVWWKDLSWWNVKVFTICILLALFCSNYFRDRKHDREFPQKVAFWFREMGPRKFQRNLGWWNIIFWPDPCGVVKVHSCDKRNLLICTNKRLVCSSQASLLLGSLLTMLQT